jgi:ribosomal-protein-alanine N-acetyltransferase
VKLINALGEGFRLKDEIRWGITRRGEDIVIGMVGYNFWARADNRAAVGYDLARAAWGQGIMPEALQRIIEFGWERMGLNRIEADCSADNPASVRVLEKVGFTLEGRQREQYYDEDGYHDLLLWGLLRRDYTAPGYHSR